MSFGGLGTAPTDPANCVPFERATVPVQDSSGLASTIYATLIIQPGYVKVQSCCNFV